VVEYLGLLDVPVGFALEEQCGFEVQVKEIYDLVNMYAF